MSVTSRLSLPTRKMLMKDLKTLQPAENNTPIKDLSVWTCSLGTMDEISLVWIQGTVVKEEDAQLFVKDTTGMGCVLKTTTIPLSCESGYQGKYIMAVGELMLSGDVPQIKAMKIQDLSQDQIAEQAWPHEVKDQHRFT